MSLLSVDLELPRRAGSASARPRRALILAAAFRLQYRVLRCAAMCFEDVYVQGMEEASPLGRSRACAGFFPVTGSFAQMDEALVPEINALCRMLSIDYVLPSCGETTRFLAAFGSKLEVPHYPTPSLQVFDTLDNKWLFAGLCKELGVPHPKTMCFATSADLLNAESRGSLGYPFIVKPLGMWGSFGVRKVDAPANLPADLHYQPILAQEYVPGEDVSAFFACRDGEVTASIAYTRDHHSLSFTRDLEVERYARIIIKHLAYSGIVGFDVRRDVNGRLAFIECNPRFWYRMDLALIVGLNMVKAGLGISDESGLAQPQFGKGITIQLSRGLLRAIFAPWRLNRHDRAFIRYLVADPVFNTRAAAGSLLRRNQGAGGQFFMLLLCELPRLA